MLHDRWINPSDEVAENYALFSADIPESLGDGSTRELVFTFDADSGKAELSCGGKKIADCKISRKAPIGISYLHLQSSRKSPDAGMYVLSVAANGF